MATTRLLEADNGAVTVWADYNDGNKRVTTIRCINNGSGGLRVTLLDPVDSSIVHQVTFVVGTTQLNVPQGKTATVMPNGEVELGYDIRISYPVT